jgi:hypothetical protein
VILLEIISGKNLLCEYGGVPVIVIKKTFSPYFESKGLTASPSQIGASSVFYLTVTMRTDLVEHNKQTVRVLETKQLRQGNA